MKKVLVLGAGLVAGPLVNYLLEHGYHVTVASRTLSKAETLIGGHSNGKALEFDITKTPENLKDLVAETDLAVSLLPYIYHVDVAKQCIAHKKHLVTTSYVSDEMRALDAEAKAAGVVFLNELGVDPGIDHMSAMKIIDRVHKAGGKIISFSSYCGGLPAPEANTNPYGYKFSWSPRGVLLAARNSGLYLKDGKKVFIPGEELFKNYEIVDIETLGEFEGYPNRDSLKYIDLYNIPETKSMFRGTLRNKGWCNTLIKFVELGFLEENELDVKGKTYQDLMAMLIKSSDTSEIKKQVAKHLDLPEDSEIIKRFEWLDLFSTKTIPFEKSSPLDILVAVMLDKMQYEKGERDMLILQHEFIAEYPDRKEKIYSTMIDFGIKDGPSSMSRTVSLPAAIGVRLILEGKITSTGVQIPVTPEFYEPILEELEQLDIVCEEKVVPL
ncbi:MAG: saccharopine dehydrogenase C-terminal domain-containing protein [Candidatus Hermodarchaeota archaeon]